MLQFKEAFSKGQHINVNDIPTILQCENIDFGHVIWNISSMYSHILNVNNDFMVHLVNNIIDISVHGNNDNRLYHSFISGIISNGNTKLLGYVINNRCINSQVLIDKTICYGSHERRSFIRNLLGVSTYLNNISSNKFTGYYNLEKYHYMIHIMLLVTRVQTVLPRCIIKHLIIPFIYR